MLEQSLIDEVLSCEGVTSFTTTGLSESEANEYVSLPKKYDVVFIKTVNSGYSVLVEPKITPKGVVQDFGIDYFIENNIGVIVKDINETPANEQVDNAVSLAYRILSIEPTKNNFEAGVRKYSNFVNSVDVAATLSTHVLEYIIDKANEKHMFLSLNIQEVRAFKKAGVKHD